MSVDDDPLIPSDDLLSDPDFDVDTQSDGASEYEPENESEGAVTARASDVEKELLLQPNQPWLKSFSTRSSVRTK